MTTESQTSPGGFEARPPRDTPPRSPAEIEADIEQTRVRLAGTVDAIAERVKPANVARRGAESAKAQVIDDSGHVRVARVAVVAVAAAAVVGFMVWRHRR